MGISWGYSENMLNRIQHSFWLIWWLVNNAKKRASSSLDLGRIRRESACKPVTCVGNHHFRGLSKVIIGKSPIFHTWLIWGLWEGELSMIIIIFKLDPPSRDSPWTGKWMSKVQRIWNTVYNWIEHENCLWHMVLQSWNGNVLWPRKTCRL